jgi:hypothetical protein
MRLNPVPLLMTPGVAVAGYVIGGGSGLAISLGAWFAIVVGATGWAYLRYQRAKRAQALGHDGGGN